MKLLEKKNLGIPVTLLVLIAYFIGYYLANNLSGLLVAVIFGGIVFALDFDERVKTAVKQAYFVGLFFSLLHFCLDILNPIIDMVTPVNSNGRLVLMSFFSTLQRYINDLFSIFVIAAFAIFIITSLINKDIKLNFISGFFGEGITNQKPVQGITCTKCGTVNKEGTSVCTSCGTKL